MTASEGPPVCTIGHSNHETDEFLALLRMHGVDAVADVRSSPYSRYVPRFSKEDLKRSLTEAGIAYVYLGAELGGRSDNPECYRDGRIDYARLAREPAFARGVERVREGRKTRRIALMCAEKDPADCHRGLLVAPRLEAAGIPVLHIRADGSIETQAEFENRLLDLCGLGEPDMFKSREETLAEAYAKRADRVGHRAESVSAGREDEGAPRDE